MANTRTLKDEEKYGLILYAQSVDAKTSTICSDHCRTQDYERQLFSLPGLGKPNYPKLIKTDNDLLCFDDSIWTNLQLY